MAVKIRLQRKGRKKAPFYFIVVADARSPRDGRFIEKLGTYNPLTIPATIDINRERAYEWLSMGAQPTDTVNAILRFKGVLYQKHLQRGVKKGALTPEQAEAKLAEWVAAKEAGIEKRRDQHLEKKRQAHASVDGTPKARAVKAEPVAEEPVAAAEEAAAEAAEEAVAETEAAVETPEAETPAAEEKTEE